MADSCKLPWGAVEEVLAGAVEELPSKVECGAKPSADILNGRCLRIDMWRSGPEC